MTTATESDIRFRLDATYRQVPFLIKAQALQPRGTEVYTRIQDAIDAVEEERERLREQLKR